MNFNFLDICIIIFLLASIVIGYYKGFTKRFLSFICTIAALIGAYLLSKPVSLVLSFKINALTNLPSEVVQNIYPIIYRMVAFVVLVIILMVVKVILIVILKPLVKSIIDGLKLTRTLDGILGSMLSLVQSTILSYIVLIMMCLPINPKTYQMVNHSLVGNKILELIPSISKSVKGLNELSNFVKTMDLDNFKEQFDLDKIKSLDENSLKSVRNLAKSAMDLGVVSEEEITQYCNQVVDQINQIDTSVSVTPSQKEEIDKILELPGVTEELKLAISRKINVQ
ncbi:MAG: CvpA family protein [Beduini sp.]